jgi:hypothetical protein
MCTYRPRLSLSIQPLLLVAFFSPAVLAADEEEVPWDSLRDMAGRYIAVCSTPETVKALNKKLKQSVAQRVADNGDLDEDSALRSMMLDWAAGNEDAIKRRDTKALTQSCVYLLTFLNKGYTLPEQVRTRLTPDAVRAILQSMESEIAAAQPQPPQPGAPATAKNNVVTRK